MYRTLSRVYPKFIRKKMEHILLCADVKIKEDEFTSFMFAFSFCASLLVALFVSIYVSFNFFIFIGLFVGIQFVLYFLIYMNADKKAKFIESILPDCLQLTASNLRAGFTTERAFLLSARPEFGPFAEELSLIAKKLAGGKNLESALLDAVKKVKSTKFEGAVNLIIFGIKSGGELAELLDQTAQNLRNQEIVEARIKANVSMYFIFIFATICFAAPLLFGLSSFMAEIITKQLSMINIPAGMPVPFTIGKPQVEPSFIITFVIVVLVTLSTVGSLILGVINRGEIRDGVKYIPIIIACSLGVFFLVRLIIKSVFSFFLT